MKKMGVVLLAMMMFLITACGGGEKPEDAVINALGAIKSYDVETAQKYFSEEGIESINESVDDESEEYVKLIFEKLTFSVEKVQNDNDKTIVTTEITNVDMQSIIQEYMKNLFGLAFSGLSEEDMDQQANEMIVNLLSREDNPVTTKVVEISLTKKESSWKIEMTDELLNALTGGLQSMGESMGESMGSSDVPEDDKLSEINRWLTLDIWNAGFCDIDHFIGDGKNSVGQTMDIDFTLEQLKKSMEKKSEYDAYINDLQEAQYENIQDIWGKLSPEIDRLYGQLESSKPNAGDETYDFDLGLYSQYKDAFKKAIEELE